MAEWSGSGWRENETVIHRDGPPRCLNPHVPSPQSHCEALAWNAPSSGGGVRIVRRTCDCEAIFYELCQSDDLRFVRRTRRTPGHSRVEESRHWPVPEADALWAALLAGLVR